MAGNSRSGRPRKPIALHINEGTFREDRHGERGAIVDPSGAPAKPKGIGKDAGKLWDEVVPELVKLGVAKKVDGSMLESMCQWWGVYRAAMRQLLKRPNKDTRIEADTAWRNYAAAASRFGLNPCDRAKLQIEKPKKRGGVEARVRA